MMKLVAYDASSDEADCSGNEDDEECQKSRSRNESETDLTDAEIISRLVNQLVENVSEGKTNTSGASWIADKTGYVDMRWRNAAKYGKNERKRKLEEQSGSDWSDLDSWSSDTSSSSSDSETDKERRKPIQRETNAVSKQNFDHEFSEDSDCVYARIVLESRNRRYGGGIFRKPPPKTKGELNVQDLPPIENLRISIPPTANIHRVGVVTSIVETLVVVQSDYRVTPLDEETWLVDKAKQPLGQIFEIFGPVPRPFYSIRFNSADDAKNRLSVGTVVFYIPDSETLTRTVFADALRRIKGSDASWEDNNEPPPEVLDFSDDEEERRWKAMKRATNNEASDMQTPSSSKSDGNPTDRPIATAKRRFQRNRGKMATGTNSRPTPSFVLSPATQNPWASFEPNRPPRGVPPMRRGVWCGPQQRFVSPGFRAPFPSPQFPPPFPPRPQFPPMPMQRPQFERTAGIRAPRFGTAAGSQMAVMDRRYIQDNP